MTALTWRETVPGVSPTGRFLVEHKPPPVLIYQGRAVGKSTEPARYARTGYAYQPIDYSAIEMRLAASLAGIGTGPVPHLILDHIQFESHLANKMLVGGISGVEPPLRRDYYRPGE